MLYYFWTACILVMICSCRANHSIYKFSDDSSERIFVALEDNGSKIMLSGPLKTETMVLCLAPSNDDCLKGLGLFHTTEFLEKKDTVKIFKTHVPVELSEDLKFTAIAVNNNNEIITHSRFGVLPHE